ncbi:hypothetical protein DXG03_009756 [Asterophora parasitica]|uniref:Uncharacterized protein n=1 Tax=Asterophora parasitica TaxID=117018 RepID=A0A9P7GAY4_9AGAR|nr:hypothetical protein DXG03_009756 [Asterophora parasitica]
MPLPWDDNFPIVPKLHDMAVTADPSLRKEPVEAPSSSGSSILSIDKKVDDQVNTESVGSQDLQDSEPKPFRLSDWLFRANRSSIDLDSTATRRSVYDTDLGEHYWPKAEYENRHRFDPKARWTFREEKVKISRIELPTHHD